ncbi:MAG: hypothetical protein RIQ41_104 [Candidatus Parcubacteria bacterium]|jgi:hypothetical protein
MNSTQARGGVKTEEGKSVSKWNALKHGILRESISDYEKLDYQMLYTQLVEEFEPTSALEILCIEIIVTNYIKLFRINKAETERMKMMLDPTIEFGISPLTERDGYEPIATVDAVTSLEAYSRYQTTAENRIYKAIMMLKALKNKEKVA